MKRFTGFSFAYAWQVVAVIILIVLAAKSTNEKTVTNFPNTNSVTNNNKPDLKSTTLKMPQYVVKGSQWHVNLMEYDPVICESCKSFTKKCNAFSVKWAELGLLNWGRNVDRVNKRIAIIVWGSGHNGQEARKNKTYLFHHEQWFINR